MTKENIPVLIQQMANQALDKTLRKDVRFNYVQTLRNIRDFCEQTIAKSNLDK